MIKSSDNKNIKFIKSLIKELRKKTGYLIIEGLKLFEEALLADIKLEKLFYSPKIFHSHKKELLILEETIKRKNTEAILISDSLISSLCDTVNPQGILAVFKSDITYAENTDINFSKGIWLLAFEIQDPGNLGTIIRTSDAAGINGIFLSKGTVNPFNPKVIRATMGSIFHTKLYFINDVPSFMLHSKNKGVKFITTHVSRGESYNKFKHSLPEVIILGNESQGIPEDIISLSDSIINIPIYGKAESLNVGVATGIILYEGIRYFKDKR